MLPFIGFAQERGGVGKSLDKVKKKESVDPNKKKVVTKFELGIGAGVSINSKPTQNESYRGDIILPNYASNLTFLANLQSNWQVGIDVHALELSRKSSTDFPRLYTAEAGGKGMKFIYGQVTSSFCATINKKINTESGYFYLGAEMGFGLERDANTRYPTGKVYYMEPDGGRGLVYGAHAGYTQYITENIALNAEFAALVYDVKNKAEAPLIKPATTLHYGISAYPLTVGIRYRFNDFWEAALKPNKSNELPLGFVKKFEFGIGGGLSINSKPTQNEMYSANKMLLNYATDFTFLTNLKSNWQIGLDVHVLELSRSSTYKSFPNLYTQEGNGKGMKFIYGQITSSFCATINKKINTKTGYFYLGAEMGLGIERDAHTRNPKWNVFYMEPDGGYGLVYGPHAGYTRNITEKIALYSEFAALVYDVNNKAEAPLVKPLTNLHYRIASYPLTIGIRYRFDDFKEAISKSSNSIFNQSYEIGIGAGVSVNGKPSQNGNEPYRGDIIIPNYATNFTFLANLIRNWQVGIALHVLELSRKSSVDFPQLYTDKPGGKGMKFIYGKVTSSLCATINKKINTEKGYYYFGAEMGLGIERDAFSDLYSKHPVGSVSTHPTGNVYYIEPDGGYGFVAGPHAGYTRNITDKIALNAEFATLVYDVNNKAQNPLIKPNNQLHYGIISYPFTIGIRYGLGNSKEASSKSDKPISNNSIIAQNYEIGIGGGLSINSKPSSNETYKGDIITPNYATNFTFLANLNHNFQIGVDFHVLELSRKSSVDFPQLYSLKPGGKGMEFIYGKVTTSYCATINKKINTKTGYFYVGGELGLGIERDALKDAYSIHPVTTITSHPTGNVYYIEPDGGFGIVGGPHAGYTRNITERIALNAEFAALFYDVYNNAEAPLIKPVTTLHYRIESSSLTIGVRYKFGNFKEAAPKSDRSASKPENQ